MVSITKGSFSNIDYKELVGGGGSPAIVKNMDANVNSQNFTTNLVFTSAKNGRITISSNKDYATLSLDMPLSPIGTYPISAFSAFKAAYADQGNFYEASTGSVTITSHDFTNNVISGTFYFSTTNGYQITNGSFLIVY